MRTEIKKEKGIKVKRKNWKMTLIFTGILLLLMIAYMVPVAVTKAEDKSLDEKKKTFEIEEVSIVSDSSSFMEELQDFSYILSSQIIISQSGNEWTLEDEDIINNENDAEFMKKQVMEFLCLLGTKESVEISDFSYITSVMASMHTGNIYVIWECSVCDDENNEFVFWLDDTTGKVLAFQSLQLDFWEDTEAFRSSFSALGEYYGFADCEVGELYFEEKVSESEVIFRNEDADGPELMLPIYKSGDSIVFNLMY